MAGVFWPDTFSQTVESPTLMIGFCVVFALGVSYIAYNGVTGSTGVNIAVNVIQISALIVFSVIAIGYRTSHNKDNDPGLYYASTSKAVPYQVYQDKVQDTNADGTPKFEPKYEQEVGKDGKPVVDKDGNPVYKQDVDKDGKLLVDKDGNPVYKQEVDKDGKPVNKQDVDKDGKPKFVQDVDNDGKPLVDKAGKPVMIPVYIPVYVQDQWADNDKTPKVDPVLDKDGKPVVGKDGKPVTTPTWKTADKIIAKEDLANTDLPLPDSYDSKGFGKETIGLGDPFPDYEKDKDGKAVLGKDGKIQPLESVMSYAGSDALSPGGTALTDGKPDYSKDPATFNYHTSAASVVAPHSFNFAFIQACIAILILVGFESVTSMGEEAKNAKRDIPRAVLLSLVIQGVVCYLIEYFAANYFLNKGYPLPSAASSGAPIGDMMVITGTWLFGSYDAARWYMLVQAATVFLALIGTTLSCINTGARVTYAMGRDDEVPSHFGLLHGNKLTPHRAIWTLACVSTVIGVLGVIWYLCGSSAPDALNTALTDAQKNSIWYPKFLTFSKAFALKIPNSLLVVTLISNFGTFLLYMLTCVTAVVAFREHHMFNGIKHFVIPVFGLLANFACMLFYLIGPWMVAGMSVLEPYVALGVVAVWGLYGAFYFSRASKAKGRGVLLTEKPVAMNANANAVGAI
jgi:amino acid transporter